MLFRSAQSAVRKRAAVPASPTKRSAWAAGIRPPWPPTVISPRAGSVWIHHHMHKTFDQMGLNDLLKVNGEKFIDEFAKAGADIFTFHPETTADVDIIPIYSYIINLFLNIFRRFIYIIVCNITNNILVYFLLFIISYKRYDF